MAGDNPFEALGLPPEPDLTDDEVRAAWRRIAASTHPDLADGGNPARFAAAAAAYAELRTTFGRTEAYADLCAATRSPARAGFRPVTQTDPPIDSPAAPQTGSPGSDSAHAVADGATPRRSLLAQSGFVWLTLFMWRLRRGRPVMLVVRITLAATVIAVAIAVAGWQPATLAVAIGIVTWLICTSRYDLAPAPRP